MTFLAIVGAVAWTAAMIWGSVGFISMMFLSDNTGREYYIAWAVIVTLIIAGWTSWWFLIGTRINITIG